MTFSMPRVMIGVYLDELVLRRQTLLVRAFGGSELSVLSVDQHPD